MAKICEKCGDVEYMCECDRTPEQGLGAVVAWRKDAARYQFLRNQNLNVIEYGGVFVGMTPVNIVLNSDDLDAAIDAAMGKN